MPTEVKGAIELRRALRQFEPDLAKSTDKEIRAVLKPMVNKARGFMPANKDMPSGWLKRDNAQGKWATRFYDQSLAKRGIVSKIGGSKSNNKGWKSIAAILNKSAGGAIYETAGRKSGIVGRFTPNLPEAHGIQGKTQKMSGRAIFKAAFQDEGKATAGVQKALKTAEDKFYGRTR